MPSSVHKAPRSARTPNPSPLLNGAIMAVCKLLLGLRLLTSTLPVGSELIKMDERCKSEKEQVASLSPWRTA